MQSKAKVISAVTQRELGAYFNTPVAYVAGSIFLVASALVFFSLFFVYGRAELTRFFELLPLLLALLIPALGMRQYVSERRGGMYEVLTTLPVGETEILIGKTIALWLATILMLLPSLLFAVTVALLGRLDPGPAVTGYLGALLLAAAYSGVSMFAATLSRSVIVALLVAVALTMVLASLETIVPIVPPALVPLLRILSVTYHVGLFSRGVIDALSVSYLISVAVGALALARHTARVRR